MSFFNLNDINNRIAKGNISKSYANNELFESIKIAKSLTDKVYDIFLSHSFLDSAQILVIKNDIEELGFTVYVDWIEDSQLDRNNVNRNTALLIKMRMKKCKSLFFATTENYSQSKWMPWELGLFDGLKEKVAILPVLQESFSSFKGSEYLELYPYVDKAIFNTLYINEPGGKFVQLSEWLKGKKPYKH